MGADAMHIGELAERTGLSHRTLRHYDDVGLLQPSGRSEGGYRLYTAADEERLLLIRRMKPLGYSLAEMRELLEVVSAMQHAHGDGAARARFDEIRAEALERRATLARQLDAADEFLHRLDDR